MLFYFQMLAKKVEHAIAEGLGVVFCVGETQEERKANKSEEVSTVWKPACAPLNSLAKLYLIPLPLCKVIPFVFFTTFVEERCSLIVHDRLVLC